MVQSSVSASFSYSLIVDTGTDASWTPTRPTLLSSFIADFTHLVFFAPSGNGQCANTKSIALSQNTPSPGSLITSPPGTSGTGSGSSLSTASDTQMQCPSTRVSMTYLALSASTSRSFAVGMCPNAAWSQPIPRSQ